MKSRVFLMTGILLGLGLFLAIRPALADDINPPDYSGDPNSVHVEWVDETKDGVVDITRVSFSCVEAGYSLTPYEPEFTDYNNYLEFYVPNFEDENHSLSLKYVRVQIAWYDLSDDEELDSPVINDVIGQDNHSENIYGERVYQSDIIAAETAGAYYYYEDWVIESDGCVQEYVYIYPFDRTQTELCQVVIDSVYVVPIPGALWLLGSGLLVLLGIRRGA